MRDRIFHWVRHEALNDWFLCGWVFAMFDPMHHHSYSFMMEWLCDCPMRKPR
jgi:hypothetical protein